MYVYVHFVLFVHVCIMYNYCFYINVKVIFVYEFPLNKPVLKNAFVS